MALVTFAASINSISGRVGNITIGSTGGIPLEQGKVSGQQGEFSWMQMANGKTVFRGKFFGPITKDGSKFFTITRYVGVGTGRMTKVWFQLSTDERNEWAIYGEAMQIPTRRHYEHHYHDRFKI